MKRALLLGGLLAFGSLSMTLAAFQAPAAPKVVEVEKLRDNLWVLKGGGGTTAVFVGSAGITVVDTKNPGWGQPILDKIKELSNKPVVRIINTHTHGDHVSGNVEFPATVDVVVQENTAANMKKMAPDRPVLLWSWSYERRCLGCMACSAGSSRRRHLLGEGCSAPRRQQRRQRGRNQQLTDEGS
jgi:glyoxylase-like metal-dependent hydrolase (beta-lactamase superfamily II)